MKSFKSGGATIIPKPKKETEDEDGSYIATAHLAGAHLLSGTKSVTSANARKYFSEDMNGLFMADFVC